MKKLLVSLLLALSAAGLASAADTALRLEPAHTEVNWVLADVLHTVKGTFALKSGSLKFDPAAGTASGRIVIDATSGNSGSDARDSRMHKNVLESARFPEIVFEPQSFTGEFHPGGTSQLTVHGLFSIHGASHPLDLKVTTADSAATVTIDTTFSVPYVAWGMKNPSLLMLKVGDNVQISVHASASRVQ
jgi:polyisoprenoid-binding protein YceI